MIHRGKTWNYQQQIWAGKTIKEIHEIYTTLKMKNRGTSQKRMYSVLFSSFNKISYSSIKKILSQNGSRMAHFNHFSGKTERLFENKKMKWIV